MQYRFRRRLSADIPDIHRTASSTSIPSTTRSSKNEKTKKNILPFLRVDVIAPTPSATPLPPEYNSVEAIPVSITHNNIRVNYNVEEKDDRDTSPMKSIDDSSIKVGSETNLPSNETDHLHRIEPLANSKTDVSAAQVLLETSFDQYSTPNGENSEANHKDINETATTSDHHIISNQTPKPTAEESEVKYNDNIKNESPSMDTSNAHQDTNNFLNVDNPMLRQRELRSSIKSTRSERFRNARSERLSVDQSSFHNAPLRSSFRSTSRPERKSLSLSIPHESNKVIAYKNLLLI